MVGGGLTAYPSGALTWVPAEPARRLLGGTAAFAVILSIDDRILPQAQMFLNHGSLGVALIKLKPLFILAAVAAFLCFGFRSLPRVLLQAWLCFMTYLCVTLFVHLTYVDKELKTAVIELVATYNFLLLLPLAFGLTGSIKDPAMRRALIAMLIPLAFVGIAQHLSSSPIVRQVSSDGTAIPLRTWKVFGEVRATSLCSSPLRFGYFLSFMLPIVYFSAVQATSRVVRAGLYLVLLLAIVALYMTMTRNAYILGTEAFVAAWLIRRRVGFIRQLPLLFLGVSLLVLVLAATFYSTGRGASVELSGDSLEQRLNFWEQYLEVWTQTDVPTLLFGNGLSQMVGGSNSIVVDNLLIGTGIQIGLIGVILFFWLLWQLWATLTTPANLGAAAENPGLAGSIAFWSTFLASGVFNYSSATYLLFFFLSLMIVRVDEGVCAEHLHLRHDPQIYAPTASR